MKKNCIASLTFLWMILSNSIFSQINEQAEAQNETTCDLEKKIKHHFFVGGQQCYTQLKFNNPSTLDGFLTGVAAAYRFEYCRYFASVNYEGYWTTGGLTGDACQRSNLSENFVYLDTGYLFYITSYLDLGPYIGVQYDLLRNAQDPQHHPLVYNFQKINLPVGLKVLFNIEQYLTVGIVGEVRPDVFSEVCVVNTTLRLHKKLGARVETPLVFHINPPSFFDLCLIPFFDWNEFGSATEKNSQGIPFPIPDLIRWEIGVRLLAGFHF